MWDSGCSTGVSVTPPLTLRFPPKLQRHVTSLLCCPAQEDLSKNVFLFKGFQQPFFLLSLPSSLVCVGVCVCSSVIIYIAAGPINRNRWDADEDAEGRVFPYRHAAIYSQGSCFVTRSLNVAQLRDILTRCASLQCRGHLYTRWPLAPAASLLGLSTCVPGLFRNCQFFSDMYEVTLSEGSPRHCWSATTGAGPQCVMSSLDFINQCCSLL